MTATSYQNGTQANKAGAGAAPEEAARPVIHTIVDIKIISDEAGVRELKPEWDGLYAACAAAAPPLSCTWTENWWKLYGPVYGDRGRGLRILTVRRGGELVGVLPMYEGYRYVGGVGIRQLAFITAGAAEFEETCADYLGLLYAPGTELLCADAIKQALKASRELRWDEIRFPNMRDSTPLKGLAAMFAELNCRTEVKELLGCHVCDLTGGFDGYLQRLSARNRKQARAVLRDVDKAALTFEIARDAERASYFFDQMVELHRKRWKSRGESGSFSPRHAQFHRSILTSGAASGEVLIGRLSQDDVPISLFYGQRAGPTFHCYQQGTDTEMTSKVRSPGIAAALLMVRYTTTVGITLFDFEQGINPFKERFCTGLRPLVDVHVRKRNLRSLMYATAEIGKRGIRKAVVVGRRFFAGKPAAQAAAPSAPPADKQDE